jgi:hypothetical protein
MIGYLREKKRGDFPKFETDFSNRWSSNASFHKNKKSTFP